MNITLANPKNDIQQKVEELGPWFHNLDLRGVQTAPNHFLGDYPKFKFKTFSRDIPKDLSGKTVLDIGCNAGFYSIEMKRRGADRVLAIDFDDHYLAQARYAAEVLEADIEFAKMSVYDLAKLGEKFDLVIFMGVLYHLRHPLLALDLIRENVTRDLLLFQSMQRGDPCIPELQHDYEFEEESIFEDPSYPRMFFVEKRYCGDPTNWWIPNRSCSAAMLRSAGFEIINNPEEEVFLCRISKNYQQGAAVYPARRK